MALPVDSIAAVGAIEAAATEYGFATEQFGARNALNTHVTEAIVVDELDAPYTDLLAPESIKDSRMSHASVPPKLSAAIASQGSSSSSLYQPLEPLPYDWIGVADSIASSSSHSSALPPLSTSPSSLPSTTSSRNGSALNSPISNAHAREPDLPIGSGRRPSYASKSSLAVHDPNGTYFRQAPVDPEWSIRSDDGPAREPAFPSVTSEPAYRDASASTPTRPRGPSYQFRRPSTLSVSVPPLHENESLSAEELENLMHHVDRSLDFHSPPLPRRRRLSEDLDNAVVPPSLPLEPSLGNEQVELAGVVLSADDLALLRAETSFPAVPRSAPAWQTSFSQGSTERAPPTLPAAHLYQPNYSHYSNGTLGVSPASLLPISLAPPPPAGMRTSPPGVLSRSHSSSRFETHSPRHHPYNPPLNRRGSSADAIDLARFNAANERQYPGYPLPSPPAGYYGHPPQMSHHGYDHHHPSWARPVHPGSPLQHELALPASPGKPAAGGASRDAYAHAQLAPTLSPGRRTTPLKSPGGKPATPRRTKATAGAIESGGTMFVNYSTHDSKKLMGGVAPSGNARKRKEDEDFEAPI